MTEQQAKPEFTRLAYVESERTYYFPNNERVTIKNVAAVCARPNGSHRLETTDGRKWIVPAGFLAISFAADDWTF